MRVVGSTALLQRSVDHLVNFQLTLLKIGDVPVDRRAIYHKQKFPFSGNNHPVVPQIDKTDKADKQMELSWRLELDFSLQIEIGLVELLY